MKEYFSEQAILEYIESTQDSYYDSVISQDTRYEVWYHLSRIRTALYAWLDFHGHLLEIGGEFGALTGFFLKKCKHVTVTESCPSHAKAIARRHKQCENLTIVPAEFRSEDFQDCKFDFIVISNGVLSADLLSQAMSLLAMDGRLLFIARNRMGAKYMCGATAEGGLPFSAFSEEQNNVFYSRAELDRLMMDSGIKNYKLYYPFPDFDFPNTLFTDLRLPTKSEIITSGQHIVENPLGITASFNQAFLHALDNGIFHLSTNSYLIEAGTTSDILYAKMASDRADGGSETIIHPDYVEKRGNADGVLADNLNHLAKKNIPVIDFTVKGDSIVMPFVQHPTAMAYLFEHAGSPDNQKLVIDKLYYYIQRSGNGSVCSFPEMNAFNCFYDEMADELIFFDIEYPAKEYSIDFVLYRTLCHLQEWIPVFGLTDKADEYAKMEQVFLNDILHVALDRSYYNLRPKASDATSTQSLLADSFGIKNRAEMHSIHLVLLDLIKQLQAICNSHNMCFYMASGTLLGATRKGGFIEWDDDADFIMPRKDFDKLCEIASQTFAYPYFLRHNDSAPGFYGPGAKLMRLDTAALTDYDLFRTSPCGISIDISPLDTTPFEYGVMSEESREYDKTIRQASLICKYVTEKESYVKDIPEYYVNKYLNTSENELAEKDRNTASSYTREGAMARYKDLLTRYNDDSRTAYYQGRYRKELFENTTIFPFEHLDLPAPSGEGLYLRIMYGYDYAKPAPITQKKQHYKICDPARSYQYYRELFSGALDCIGKTVVIYGTGIQNSLFLNKYGNFVRPAYFTDSNTANHGKILSGIEIIPPEEILTRVPLDRLHLIVCSIYHREIGQRLNVLGIEKYKVWFES